MLSVTKSGTTLKALSKRPKAITAQAMMTFASELFDSIAPVTHLHVKTSRRRAPSVAENTRQFLSNNAGKVKAILLSTRRSSSLLFRRLCVDFQHSVVFAHIAMNTITSSDTRALWGILGADVREQYEPGKPLLLLRRELGAPSIVLRDIPRDISAITELIMPYSQLRMPKLHDGNFYRSCFVHSKEVCSCCVFCSLRYACKPSAQ